MSSLTGNQRELRASRKENDALRLRPNPMQTSSGSCQRIGFARGRRQKRGRRNPGARKVDSGIIRARMGESRNHNGRDSFPLPRFTPPSGPCPAAPQGLSWATGLSCLLCSAPKCGRQGYLVGVGVGSFLGSCPDPALLPAG